MMVAPKQHQASPDTLWALAKDTVKFWELGRVGYNAVLLAVTIAWLVFTWPHFRPALTWSSGLRMLLLAAMANACYCAAYPLDLALQCSPSRPAWRHHRWMLWGVGTLFAVLLACYWIGDEIYSDFN